MRIVLVSRVTGWHRPGGLGHVVQDRAIALAKAGHEVRLLTTPGTNIDKFPRMDGLGLIEIPCKSLEWSEEFARGCVKWCNEWSPDVIHMDSIDRWRPWWESRPGNPKCIATTLHGEDVTCSFTDYRKWLHGKTSGFSWDLKRIREEIDALKGFDVVIATARFDQWVFSDLLGLGHCPLVYNPVAECFFDTPRVPRPEKGPALFCAMWGDEDRGYSIARKACEIADVTLIRPKNVPREQLVSYYDRCSCMLLPSYQSQGFDVSVAECLVRWRPVVTSNVGLWSFESEQYNGIHCAADFNPGSYAKLMELSCGQTITAKFSEQFHPANHAKAWIEAVRTED